jgi:hypothetical protein
MDNGSRGNRVGGSGATQDRLNAGHQFTGAEGLDHIVIGAQGESGHPVDLLAKTHAQHPQPEKEQ